MREYHRKKKIQRHFYKKWDLLKTPVKDLGPYFRKYKKKSSILVLKLHCTLESPEDFQKLLGQNPIATDSDLIGLGPGLGIRTFKYSPGDSVVAKNATGALVLH